MKLYIVPLLLHALLVPNAGATIFGDPPITQTKYVDETFSFSYLADPTDKTGTDVVASPFTTLTVIMALASMSGNVVTVATNVPTVATTVPGASITPFIDAGKYKFILVLGNDATPSGELFNATFKCPSTAGTYTFTIQSATATNAAGASVQINLPVTAPDTIVVKARPRPWWMIWRIK